MAMINDLSNRIKNIIKSQDFPIAKNMANSRDHSIDSSGDKRHTNNNNNKIKVPQKHYTMNNSNNNSSQGNDKVRPPLTPGRKRNPKGSLDVNIPKPKDNFLRISDKDIANSKSNTSRVYIEQPGSHYQSVSNPSQRMGTTQQQKLSQNQQMTNFLYKSHGKRSEKVEQHRISINGINKYLQDGQIEDRHKNRQQSGSQQSQRIRKMSNRKQKKKQDYYEQQMRDKILTRQFFDDFQHELFEKIKKRITELVDPIINDIEDKLALMMSLEKKLQNQTRKNDKISSSRLQKLEERIISNQKQLQETKQRLQLIENELNQLQTSYEDQQEEEEQSEQKSNSHNSFRKNRFNGKNIEIKPIRNYSSQSKKFKQFGERYRQAASDSQSRQIVKLPPKQSASRQSASLSNKIADHIGDIVKQLNTKIIEMNDKFQIKIENLKMKEESMNPFLKQHRCQCKPLVDQILKSQEHLAMELKYIKHFQGLSRPYQTHSVHSK